MIGADYIVGGKIDGIKGIFDSIIINNSGNVNNKSVGVSGPSNGIIGPTGAQGIKGIQGMMQDRLLMVTDNFHLGELE